MSTRLAERSPVPAPGADRDAARWSRPQVVVLLERLDPTPWSLRRVAWFARRLGADLLVASVTGYDRSLDELDRLNLQIAGDAVRRVTARLVEQGARAVGEVGVAACGDRALSAFDLADRLDADLVIVLARRGSWLGLFPGSPLAHQLMRRHRRPVLVIPDHERPVSWRAVLLELIRLNPPQDEAEPA